MQKIDFDLNKFVDLSFKSLGGYFITLPIALDLLMAFLTEGVKIVFRFTYALMKYHKQLIKSCKSPEELIVTLRTEAKQNTDSVKLKKIAYRYALKKCHT